MGGSLTVPASAADVAGSKYNAFDDLHHREKLQRVCKADSNQQAATHCFR